MRSLGEQSRVYFSYSAPELGCELSTAGSADSARSHQRLRTPTSDAKQVSNQGGPTRCLRLCALIRLSFERRVRHN